MAVLMLRTMQKARYATANLGHFGLAFSSYTHFTSPIRRYPDLVVHRLLRAARAAGADARGHEDLADALPEIARLTSDRERRADEAERELVQWKKVRFMADKVGDEFDGYITGVASFGLFVELVEHFVEGLVHVSSMADDFYRFVEPTHTLRGENTSGLPARRSGARAGRAGGPRQAANRTRARRDPGGRPEERAAGRAAAPSRRRRTPAATGSASRSGNGSALERTPGVGAERPWAPRLVWLLASGF